MSGIHVLTRFWWAFLAVGVLAVVLAIGLPALTTQGADHLDAPLVNLDGRLDINDVYAFKKGDNTVLVMTVNPLAGVLSSETFHPIADYDFKIDNDDDDVEDIVYRLNFSQASSKSAAPSQRVTLTKSTDGGATFPAPPIAEGEVSAPAKGDKAKPKIIPVDGGGSLFAGLRDDPFFFDLVSFLDGLAFCPADPAPDFFAGLNVSAIVLEVPSGDLGGFGAGTTIHVWATTGTDGGQFERMGIPVINTVLIPSGSKDAFNATVPADDVADWSVDVEASLLAISALDGTPYSAAEALAIAGVLLPDVLTLDTSSTDGFLTGPLNGRQLAEDVIDFELLVVSGGFFGDSAFVDDDCVDENDVSFLTSFPYLAPPH